MSLLQELWEQSVHSLLKIGPVEWASGLGSVIVRTNVRHFRKEVAAGARRNLAIHFPGMDPAEIEARTWRFVDNVGRLMGEFSILHRLEREGRLELFGADEIVAIQGHEPIIAIVLHTGNWEVLGAGLRQAGIRTATFYEPPESRVQRRIVVEARERFGFRLLSPDSQGLRDAIKILRENGIVSIFGDEARDGRTMAPLFGRPPHDRGNLAIAARLARKLKSRLVVTHVERLPRCYFNMHISEPFALPDGPNRTLLDDIAFLNTKIEPVILDHLDSWYFLDDLIEPLD
jgi:lauroyl/myristoyl acyltransferase